jgi:hypothetical protein
MTASISRLVVPTYLRGLRVLAHYLDKAAAHAQANGIDPATLVDARLAPDMLPLSGQIQRASDTSKNGIARLLGSESPRMDDNEATLGELKTRVGRTIAWIESADAALLDAAEGREITLTFGQFSRTFGGLDYVLDFALPNFEFHVATTHAILRNQGVAVGKLDFLGVAA